MNRRDFVRKGSLWTMGALLVEEPIKRLWAFPTNPLGEVRPAIVVPPHQLPFEALT